MFNVRSICLLKAAEIGCRKNTTLNKKSKKEILKMNWERILQEMSSQMSNPYYWLAALGVLILVKTLRFKNGFKELLMLVGLLIPVGLFF